MRHLLLATSFLFLTGCATHEGRVVLEHARAAQANLIEYVQQDGDISLEAVVNTAQDTHTAISTVLVCDYGVDEPRDLEYTTDSLREAVQDLRDAHYTRQRWLEMVENLPYAGPALQWGKGIWATLAGLVGLLIGRTKRKKG